MHSARTLLGLGIEGGAVNRIIHPGPCTDDGGDGDEGGGGDDDGGEDDDGGDGDCGDCG